MKSLSYWAGGNDPDMFVKVPGSARNEDQIVEGLSSKVIRPMGLIQKERGSSRKEAPDLKIPDKENSKPAPEELPGHVALLTWEAGILARPAEQWNPSLPYEPIMLQMAQLVSQL